MMTNKKKNRKSTRRPRKYEKLKSAVKYQLSKNIKKNKVTTFKKAKKT